MQTAEEARREWLKCSASPAYFLHTYGWVYDATERGWLRFALWPAQRRALRTLAGARLAVVLKARQLGLTWLAVGYALWLMLFRPAATILLFSQRDDEAVHLLDVRLRGLYEHLPGWMRSKAALREATHQWRLSNGSTALAFPSTGGRSYTATLAVVDEADYLPDLDGLVNAIKPTIDAGGQLWLLSTADKSRPESAFKRIYRGAQAGDSGWTPLFLGWRCRPGRDEAWYERQKAEALARTGSLDVLWQEYPATELEALAARSVDARYPAVWLQLCDGTRDAEATRAGGLGQRGPALAELRVYEEPVAGQGYVIGADPAEGNPQSDESAATVLDAAGREVACLCGRLDPALFADRLGQVSAYYNDAPILVERNNHGHAVLLWLGEHAAAWLVPGTDGRPGWLTTASSKTLLFDQAAERIRLGATRVRSAATLRQLEGIRGATLAAADGQHDDRAMSFVLGLAALGSGTGSGMSAVIPAVDVIAEADRGGF